MRYSIFLSNRRLTRVAVVLAMVVDASAVVLKGMARMCSTCFYRSVEVIPEVVQDSDMCSM